MHSILMRVDPEIKELMLPVVSKKSKLDGSFIVGLVQNHFKVDIKKRTRLRKVMRGRHASCFLLKKYTKLDWNKIASLSGQGSHATAISSVKACKNWMQTDEDYKDDIFQLEQMVELAIKTFN